MIHSSELINIIQGKYLQEGESIAIKHILLDSRKIFYPQEAIFFALKTAKRNAHQFIADVYQQGVSVFVVSEPIDLHLIKKATVILVEDTLLALQRLAAWHRKKFTYPVIGITGSNGKTVVKEWLYQLLHQDKHIIRSPKSYNSQTGVPLSVWRMNNTHELALIEAGISQPGEMERLEKIIKPTLGIFTNIGEAHSEGFINQKHKINEKLLLFKDIACLVYNKDYPELHDSILSFKTQIKQATGRNIKLLHWSKKSEGELHITKLTKDQGYTLIQATWNENAPIEITIPFTDDGSIENAIHCWVLMLHFEYPNAIIQERMLSLTSVGMRLELRKGINNSTIINDTYNSDVSSLAIALDLLQQQQQHDHKTVILSDILQSGRDSDLYEEVARMIKDKKIQRFIGIGESLYRNKNLFRAIRRLDSTFYKNTDEFLQHIDSTTFQQEAILLKGARRYHFERIAKKLEERIHQTVLEINLNALLHNLNVYKSKLSSNTQIMAMVKAFSYGSGSYEIANVLQFAGVDYLAVAYVDEGIQLRKNKITLPIMVMNADDQSYSLMAEWKLEPEIYNFRTLQFMLSACTEQELFAYPIHIKLDTGMHRLGFSSENMDDLIDVLRNQQAVKVVSVFSHLAGSDDPTLDNFTKEQAAFFDTMCQKIESGIGYSFIKHLANSSAIVRHQAMQYDMVRLGLGLYGIDSTKNETLRNVSRLRTSIAQIKTLKAGETVGYSRMGVLQRDSRIATVCIGYADGIPRRLSNGAGYMYIHGMKAPIIGNVCMDMCMLDITDNPQAKEGDIVEVFGEHISVSELAQLANTIPYEILTGISQRVKRVYYEE